MSTAWDHTDLQKWINLVRVDNNHCHQYVRKESTPEKQVVLSLTVPYEILYEWQKARSKLEVPCTFIEIVNAILPEKTGMRWVKLDSNRIEERLRRICSSVKTKFTSCRGRKYEELKQKEVKLAIQLDDLKASDQDEIIIKEHKVIIDSLSDDRRVLSDRCDILTRETALSKAAAIELNQDLLKANLEKDELNLENQQLHNYIQRLGQELDFKNSSGKLTEVGDRQQRRKLKELKTKVEKALWFSKTFGLELDSVKFNDEGGVERHLSYKKNGPSSYKDLSPGDKEKVKNVLFTLDKFCIGDAAYHELTMVDGLDNLPRSYLIKQCKEEVNKLCSITQTPGVPQGAQVDFRAELVSVIQKMIAQNVFDITDPNAKLKIKVSGDGAKMSRLTSFLVISFSVLNNQLDVMSSKGNHTVAVIKGKESYELIQTSCSVIFRQINDIVKCGTIRINDRDVPVTLYLGGDYKFLLLVMGMKSATSDHACIWCKVHKKQRGDMTKHRDFYWEGEECTRSIDDIKKCALNNKFSCQHKPLLDIPLYNVVLDELHLMLRVTDKLTKNLMLNSIEDDRRANLNKRPMDRTDTNLQNLVKAICSCGVSFDIWEKMDGDGKASGHYDFTSLMGSDKRLLLQHLPKKLPGVIAANTSDKVVKLWEDFGGLYDSMKKQNQTEEQITEFFNKAISWVKLLTSLDGFLLGYTTAVTPYIHAMVYHVPKFMQLHKGIKQFTGQGVEKLNDDCRRIHLQRSNKWDAPRDILVVGKRVEHLASCARVPRTYRKQSSGYWDDGIKESRSKRNRLSAEVIVQEPAIVEVDSLTANEIKKRLKDLGVKTRYRCLKKLRELLLDTLQDKENCQPIVSEETCT